MDCYINYFNILHDYKLKKVNKLSSNLVISYNIRLVLASILNIIEIFR